MNELFFPVVGAMLVFFVAVPLLTLVARSWAALLPTNRDSVSARESPWRFLLVVGPTLGPLVWLISASIHQSEEGTPLTACAVDHLGGELCRDVVFFGTILFLVLGYGVVRRVRKGFGTLRRGGRRLANGDVSLARVHAICKQNLTLAAFTPRISVVDNGLAPACTRGLFRPYVELEAGLVRRLDDEELEAVLLHEVEHAQARDPLRFFVAQVALSINPLGKILVSELARYHFAREAICDRRAVQRGADPLALARSIVSVAAPNSTPTAVTALGGHGIGSVRLRVQLLLGYAAGRPGLARPRAPLGVVMSFVTLLAIWPHVMGAGPLDLFHGGIERIALILGLG